MASRSPDGPKNATTRRFASVAMMERQFSLLLRQGDGQYASMAFLANGHINVFYDCWEHQDYRLYFATYSLDKIH